MGIDGIIDEIDDLFGEFQDEANELGYIDDELYNRHYELLNELREQYEKICDQYDDLLSECGIYNKGDVDRNGYSSLIEINNIKYRIYENVFNALKKHKINTNNLVVIGDRLYDKTDFLEEYIEKDYVDEKYIPLPDYYYDTYYSRLLILASKLMHSIRPEITEKIWEIIGQKLNLNKKQSQALRILCYKLDDSIGFIDEYFKDYVRKYAEDFVTNENRQEYETDKNEFIDDVEIYRDYSDESKNYKKEMEENGLIKFTDNLHEYCNHHDCTHRKCEIAQSDVDRCRELHKMFDIFEEDNETDQEEAKHSKAKVAEPSIHTKDKVVESRKQINEKGLKPSSKNIKDKMAEPRNKTTDYKIINVSQRSTKWRELRVGKVTGTTAYYLKNHSVEYAIQKGREEDTKDYTNEHMKRGRELEPIGIAKFAEQKGFMVESIGFVDSLLHNTAGFSPDGVIYDNDGKIKTIIEHKAFGEKHHFACAEQIDDKVMYQIQFGIYVTGAQDAYLVLYNPDVSPRIKQLIIKHIQRDSAIQNLFEEKFKEYELKRIYLMNNNI